MKHTSTATPRLILAAFTLFAAVCVAQSNPVVDWIRAHAIRLQTPEAGHGFADMQPLKKVVGNARIVALGEPTHGTREFFQLKHRMVEFLATEMGFTIFSLQNPLQRGKDGLSKSLSTALDELGLPGAALVRSGHLALLAGPRPLAGMVYHQNS